MFLFYINDLPDNLRSFMRLFADGTIAYNSDFNHSALQEDLTKLEQCEHLWGMKFHPSYVVFSRRRQPINKNLYLHGTTIVPKTNYIRYLGVNLDPKLNWNKHVDNVTAKGNSTLGIIRNIQTSKTAINNYV